MKTEKFVFEISIDAVPHTEATCNVVFGGGYNSDFPVETHAMDLIYTALKDSYCGCLMAEMKHMGKCKCEIEDMTPADKSYHKYLQKNTYHAKRIMESVKFVRVEKSD
jgi:hypothetical protein